MPMESVFERWMRLKNCAHVDEIIPYDTERDWRNILHTVAWDVRFLDEEYKGKTFTGHDIRPDNIIYLPRQHDFSSSNLRKKLDGPK